MSAVITVSDLVKHFQPTKHELVKAVDGVSFAIEQGTCFGLLGPNGAGKTTTVEMLEGIVKPSSGSILYRGEPIGEAFRRNAGIMFQNTALQDYMTVKEALHMFGSFYEKTVPIEQLIEQCSLHEFLDRDTRKLSGGQKQRLLLAVALVNDPDVVFLDEPTTGLDPQARRNFWSLVNDIKARGATVVLTTHYMEEARILCDDLVFMDHGKIIAAGSPNDLLSSRFDDVLLELPLQAVPESLPGHHCHTVQLTQHKAEFSSTNIDETVKHLLKNGVSLTGLEIRSRTLEDLFIDLTGQGLRA